MRVLPGAAAPVAAIVVLCGCAYIGDPLPPLANVPAPVRDLAAVQRSSRIIVHFTLPAQTTEGVSIRAPLKVDLRVGTESAGAFDPGTWAAAAKPVSDGIVQKGLATFTIPISDLAGKTVTLGARVIGANGKASDWSNFVNIAVVPPPEKPSGVKTQATANGLRVSWHGPPGTFRVFRRSDTEKGFAPVAEVTGLEWTDSNTEYGKHYAYIVQRVVKPAEHQEAESDPSDTAEITPEDEFPPAVPTGLRATPAPNSIELSWDRNAEPDLAGYRLYRSIDGGAFERVAEVSQIPAWSDQKVEHGRMYRYAVTAFDQAGNESARSAVVEATL